MELQGYRYEENIEENTLMQDEWSKTQDLIKLCQ
jgi:hypothetical protein